MKININYIYAFDGYYLICRRTYISSFLQLPVLEPVILSE